jgi:hypothetical protein
VARRRRAPGPPACFSRAVPGPQARPCARSAAPCPLPPVPILRPEAGNSGGTDGPRRRPRRSRGPDAAEPRRSRRVWLREWDRRRRRQNLAPSLTSSDAPPWGVGGGCGMAGEGVLPCRSGSCLGTAVLTDLTETASSVHTAHACRRTASGARLPVYGHRFTDSHNFRLPSNGFQRMASGFSCTARGTRLLAHGLRANCSASLFGPIVRLRSISGARRDGDGSATHDSGSFILMCDCL